MIARMRSLTRAVITVAGASMLVAVGSTPASTATPRNGIYEVDEVCF